MADEIGQCAYFYGERPTVQENSNMAEMTKRETTDLVNLLKRAAALLSRLPSADRLAQCEASLSIYDAGHDSEYWLRNPSEEVTGDDECRGLDTPERVCFYEQDFYVLSNFSSFEVVWSGFTFKTSEHLYHWMRFTLSTLEGRQIAQQIKDARSAHDAFKISQENKRHQVQDWDAMKVGFMREILREKVKQHEYVKRKLLATGDRELVENSWRDDFWGWGPNRDGQNMLGKLWMQVRAELRITRAPGAVT